MSEYIDREALKAEIRKAFPSIYARTEINTIANLQPSIDIVRCKECRYNYGNEHNCEYNPEDIVCTYFESDGFDADDFCSYAERKTDGKDI